MDFVSHVDLLDPQGNVVRQADIRVNHPASIDGLDLLPIRVRLGARSCEVRRTASSSRRSRSRSSRTRRPTGVPQLAMPWHGS